MNFKGLAAKETIVMNDVNAHIKIGQTKKIMYVLYVIFEGLIYIY